MLQWRGKIKIIFLYFEVFNSAEFDVCVISDGTYI